MTISAGVRRMVRQRAGHACEYCEVSETQVGGELTIDHFRPRAHGGTDDADNLLYSCHRCNQYKADYWPVNAGDPVLWNPHYDPRSAHLVELPDGLFLHSQPPAHSQRSDYASIARRLSPIAGMCKNRTKSTA